MCLYSKAKATNKFLAEKKAKGLEYITCYKKLRLEWNGDLVSPLMGREYKAGWNKANTRRKLCKVNKRITRGIHVYLTRNRAKRCWINSITVPVRCYLKDFVGVDGHGEAVFTKVFITKQVYNKHYKGSN